MTEKLPRFVDFRVYQDAKSLHKEVFQLASGLPKKFYSLSDQVRRASLSVVLNIAEGSARGSDKDFGRFVQIALGSIYETIAALNILSDLTDIDCKNLVARYYALRNQLGALSK